MFSIFRRKKNAVNENYIKQSLVRMTESKCLITYTFLIIKKSKSAKKGFNICSRYKTKYLDLQHTRSYNDTDTNNNNNNKIRILLLVV
jgi:hypothetical protein